MRTHGKVYVSRGKVLIEANTDLCGKATDKKFNPLARAFVKPVEFVEMLARKYLCGRHKGNLRANSEYAGGCHGANHGFSRSHVSLQQPVHAFRGAKIGLYFPQNPFLGIGECKTRVFKDRGRTIARNGKRRP